MKKYLAISVVLCLITAGLFYAWLSAHVTFSNDPFAFTQASSFNKKQHSLTDPSSTWIIVNKQHPLNPRNYAPMDLTVPNVSLRVPGDESMQLRKVVATALDTMFAAAKRDGLNLMLGSGYRPYSYQNYLYNYYIGNQGQASADSQSARPGYSEHQTGLAVDIEPASQQCAIETCFAGTPESKWLMTNSYKFGFILRYKRENQAITGYDYEPWHFRYVGVDLATEMHKDHIDTLEQFFHVSGGTKYAP